MRTRQPIRQETEEERQQPPAQRQFGGSKSPHETELRPRESRGDESDPEQQEEEAELGR